MLDGSKIDLQNSITFIYGFLMLDGGSSRPTAKIQTDNSRYLAFKSEKRLQVNDNEKLITT